MWRRAIAMPCTGERKLSSFSSTISLAVGFIVMKGVRQKRERKGVMNKDESKRLKTKAIETARELL